MPTAFRSLALHPALLEVVEELGFKQLTPIQAASIPVLLAGKDLVGQSRTGSGKTAAFALPLLQKLNAGPRQLSGLILCPTRELCAQVAREVRRLGRKQPGLRVLLLVGGEPLGPQAKALQKGAHLCVGTPGRVLDHLRREKLKLDQVSTLVLDEADRMLDMGFQEDIEQILSALPGTRQTVFFSATFPPTIEAMSRKYQRDPVRVSIETEAQDKAEISQLLLRVEPEAKLKALRWVLEQHPHESALVFANLKTTVAELADELGRSGASVESLHGDLEQRDRDRVMAKFRNKSTRVLVATDVAARGIDIESLDLVVNYDLPNKPEIYVHRIGRTGRAGKTGLAISLAPERENPRVAGIEQYTGTAFTRIAQGAPAAGRSQSASKAGNTLERDAAMDTLRISGGRKAKLRPADILGALTGEAGGLRGTDIGKIEIHDQFAYVAVARSVSRIAHKSLSEGRIKGRKFLVTLVK